MKADQSDQLDLLAWSASAKVFAFPPARRTSLVRVVAEELSQGDNEKFWASVMNALMAELRGLGSLTENEIQCRLVDFRDAVQAELNRGHLARTI